MKKVEIEYCVTCNYRPIAANLGIAIERAVAVKPVLVQSNVSGAFEVLVDGERVFSKTASGRFPDHAEIIKLLQEK
ncbi:MAG: Rdx family protein [Thermodesulfovibrionales bacterium]